MKSMVKHSIWLFLVGALICIPAQGFAVTFMIGSDDILPNAVQTTHIAPSAVTNDKIATGTITQDKLAFTLSGSRFSNVVVVAKSGGDFTDPIAAVNSITGASAANPYLVKIMPGVYDLGTASLQMKEYVDVEGSGPDNTIITSSNNNVDGTTCTIGTVLMANNSSIRHIKIVNNAPALNGNYLTVAALVFNGVKAKAEGISVLVGNDTVAGGQNDGICTYGESADASLNNVSVETHNNASQSNAIITMGGKLTLTNSKLSSFNTSNGGIDVINDKSYIFATPSIVTVINSIIEGTCPNGVTGIFARANKTSIINSTITLNVGNGTSTAFYTTTSDFSMVNSRIISNGAVDYYSQDPSTVKISNSLVSGNITSLIGAKFVNNYDENFNPIPNQ